jgi:hypothetical protein
MESARRGGQRVGVAMELEEEKWSERRESLAPPRYGMHRGEAEEGIKYKKPVSTDLNEREAAYFAATHGPIFCSHVTHSNTEFRFVFNRKQGYCHLSGSPEWI